jgi:D-alanyl-D-alanine carboxypeptidase
VKKAIIFCMLLLSIVMLTMCKKDVDAIIEMPVVSPVEKQAKEPIEVTMKVVMQKPTVQAVQDQVKEPIKEPKKASVAQETFSQSFEYRPIDKELEEVITGVSWKQNNTVKIDDLCYVKVTYWGFDERPHIGELIVNKEIGKEVTEIFKDLYAAKFPIMKMKLIDEYGAIDSKSMEDNNTSAFCYREVDGRPGKLSKHSYGIAIDINPVQNPYVYKEKVSPESGRDYLDRNKLSKGMIAKNDACYKAFTSRGWTWGGNWKYEKDYQHFQK